MLCWCAAKASQSVIASCAFPLRFSVPVSTARCHLCDSRVLYWCCAKKLLLVLVAGTCTNTQTRGGAPIGAARWCGNLCDNRDVCKYIRATVRACVNYKHSDCCWCLCGTSRPLGSPSPLPIIVEHPVEFGGKPPPFLHATFG